MMLRFELLSPGKTRESWLQAGIADFTARITHFVPMDIRLPREKKGDPARIRELESKVLLESCGKGAYVVALDPQGREFSSEELADLLSRWEEQGRQLISFLIGGPQGLLPELVQRADLALSLSRMTFTHEMARLLLLEQLYRACTIRAGTKYHK